jgi:quinohemoprotein ethanol dehydrogenase
MRATLATAALSLLLMAGHSGQADVPQRYDWPHHGGQPDEAGFAALDQIDRGNVGRLGLAWSLDLPGEQSLEATPLAVGGVLYFTGTFSDVYAVSVETGKLLWKHEAKVYEHNARKMNFIFPLNRGCAYADGRIFSATTDGRLLALDAGTGKELWSVETVRRDDERYITGAPRVFNGKVIIGHGGGDTGQRGYVTAYDQKTGKQLWRFYTVPGSPEENKGDATMEMAARSWGGEYWKTGTGGTVWNGITVDPELDRIYIGTGNSGPYDPEKRSPGGGDNLFLASIVALDASTGKYIWHYQMNPREAWDYKATAAMIATTLRIDGKPRKVLMQAPTNGFFYVLDRETGKLVNEPRKTGKVTWADRIDMKTGRPVEAANIRYENGSSVIWPWTAGTHNWMAMSYNPGTGLVYIPYMQAGFRFTRAPETFSGVIATPEKSDDPHDGKGALLAWDPVAQKPRWMVWHEWIWNGGTLSTAGGLAFQGTADGWLTGYDARDGKKLWRFNAGLGIVSPPISYAWKGEQYISILVGWSGPSPYGFGLPTGWRYNAQPRRLLTLKLGGKGQLPPTPPYDETVRPLDDPSIKLDPAAVAAGEKLFHQGCNGCHGGGLQSAGAPGPDLRESPIALNEEAMWSVLHDGVLLSQGMPQFSFFTREQVHQLRSYIRAGAREELERQKAGRPRKQEARGSAAS